MGGTEPNFSFYEAVAFRNMRGEKFPKINALPNRRQFLNEEVNKVVEQKNLVQPLSYQTVHEILIEIESNLT